MAPPVTAAASILFVFAWAAAQAPPNVTAQPEERQDLEFHSPHVPKPPDDFSQYLFGDWVGVRSRLADWGVTVAALVIADPFGNLSGGFVAEQRTTTWPLSASFYTRTDYLGGPAANFMSDSPKTSEQAFRGITSAIVFRFN